MLRVFEEIPKWLDERSPVDIIYLDFQKAVDKVPLHRLILMLLFHGRRYMNQYNKRYSAMAYIQKTKGSSGRSGFKW